MKLPSANETQLGLDQYSRNSTKKLEERLQREAEERAAEQRHSAMYPVRLALGVFNC